MLKNYFEILGVDEKAEDLKILFAYKKKLWLSDNFCGRLSFYEFPPLKRGVRLTPRFSGGNFPQKLSEYPEDELIQTKDWEEKGKNYASLVAYRGKLQSKWEFCISVIMISLKEVIVFNIRFAWEFLKNIVKYL